MGREKEAVCDYIIKDCVLTHRNKRAILNDLKSAIL